MCVCVCVLTAVSQLWLHGCLMAAWLCLGFAKEMGSTQLLFWQPYLNSRYPKVDGAEGLRGVMVPSSSIMVFQNLGVVLVRRAMHNHCGQYKSAKRRQKIIHNPTIQRKATQHSRYILAATHNICRYPEETTLKCFDQHFSRSASIKCLFWWLLCSGDSHTHTEPYEVNICTYLHYLRL